MRPWFCEEEADYEVSKTFLFHWLKSESVKNILGQRDLATVVHWVRNNVLTHDQNFLYYKRKRYRTYHQITTSPHEGTNYGIKFHSASVRPCHTLKKAGRALTFQGELKMLQVGHEAAKKVMFRNTWSNSPTSQHIVPTAESLLIQIMDGIKLFYVRRIEERKWEVHLSQNDNNNEDNDDAASETEAGLSQADNDFDKAILAGLARNLPNFRKIRIVTLDGLELKCSCCLFESVGLPCSHQGAVIKFHVPEWPWFSHHDVDVEFWNIYHRFSYSQDADEELSQLLHSSRGTMKGPKFPGVRPPPLEEYDVPTPSLPPANRITNYSKRMVSEIMNDSRGVYEGLSQDGNVELHQAELFDPSLDEEYQDCGSSFPLPIFNGKVGNTVGRQPKSFEFSDCCVG